MNAVVDEPSAITPEWLTAALRAGDLFSDQEVEVDGVEAQRIGTGQMGTTYRLGISYRGSTGPPTLIAKLAAEDESARVLVASGYAAEVGFYRHLAGRLQVRTPGCWYAAIDDDHTRFTLLLDDADPAAPGIQADGCTVDQAHACLQNLLGLHTPLWSDRRLHDMEFLGRSNRSTAELLGQVMASANDSFVERYEGHLGPDDADTLQRAAAAIADWQVARLEPFSVIHGDYRLDNLLFTPGCDEVTAVDWQTAAVGPPLRDVAYFLGTSLDVSDRRDHERQLVGAYHDGLVERGVVDYDFDRCWEDYRFGMLQGPMITVLGCIYASGRRSAGSDAMFVAMARRSCAAIRDLDSLALI